jgi:hypothetical protein
LPLIVGIGAYLLTVGAPNEGGGKGIMDKAGELRDGAQGAMDNHEDEATEQHDELREDVDEGLGVPYDEGPDLGNDLAVGGIDRLGN